jgi:type VI secretion system secreted protein VgrG
LPLSGELAPHDREPGDGDFEEPHGRYVFRVADERRLSNKDLHPFIAQYNESDFDFLTRWLAHEGISFYFQHTDDASVLVLSDSPGQDAPHQSDRTAVLRGGSVAGAHKDQQIVRWLRDARRMRSRAVTMREYDYRRSSQVFDAQAAGEGESAEAFGHFEFPAKDDRLGDKLASFPAMRRLQRFEAERHLRQGMSTLRTLLPGQLLRLTDGDGHRDDEELVLVRSETFATQHAMEGSLIAAEPFGFHAAAQEVGGFENRFQVLPSKVPFRPASPPARERIWGVQVARVWGPEVATQATKEEADVFRTDTYDIHCDAHGRVQVRFPWDTRACADGQPPSDWCRVAQPWAGGGYGAVHIPRVGHEVLVAYENGDPDRPVIVGSVYTSPDTPPPYDATDAKNKTRTTLKTKSSSVTEAEEGANELRFTDYKTEEEIYLHAERDLNEVVKHNHSTSVGGDQSNSVGGNQSNTVHGNRTHDITGTESVHVHGDRTTHFDANESHTVGVNRSTDIGAVERLEVGSSRVVIVHGPDMAVVDSDDATQVGGSRTVQVKGDHTVQTEANYHSSASANHTFKSTNMYVTQAGEFQVNAASLWLNVGGCSLRMSAGTVTIDNGAGASIVLSGGNILVVSGAVLQTISGGATNLTAGGNINAAAPAIHLNG